MDGRDIGTTVMPKAELKIYLDASPEEGEAGALNLERTTSLCLSLSSRKGEPFGQHRNYSPLAKADDAVVIDTGE